MLVSHFTFSQVVVITFFAHSSCADLSIGTLWTIYRDKVKAAGGRESVAVKTEVLKQIFSDCTASCR